MKYKTNTEIQKKDRILSNDMIDKLINQIQHELYNHNLYSGFASYFQANGLPQLCNYYKGRANEEFVHHKWIVDYLKENHVEFKYPNVPEITEEYNDFITPFELTLKQEIETTNMIYEIVELAQKEKDWMTFQWLMRDSSPNLVAEQIEEESISRTALYIAEQDDSWLAKSDAINNAYYSGNPF